MPRSVSFRLWCLLWCRGVMCLWLGMEDMLHARYPREITADIYTEDDEEAAQAKTIMDQVVEEHGARQENVIEYTMLDTFGLSAGRQNFI